MKKLLLLCFLLSIISFLQQANSQEEGIPVISGRKFSITSSVLSESRELLIAAPQNYSQKLPLILVFDGESLFLPVATAVRFMNYSSEIPQMPEAVVVGIPNTDRNRDMPVPQEFGKGNGAENFMKFISDELIPDLRIKYPLNGHVILIGHSQGGYLVSWLMTRHPDIFPWVIALDAPMTVTPETAFLKDAVATVVNQQNRKLRYISVESIFGWHNEWEKYFHTYENMKQARLADEAHESMPFKGIYDGLKFLYHDFQPAHKAIPLAGLQLHYKTLSDKYGYNYEIPLKVMLASAARMQQENRKKEILELLEYAEGKYGLTPRIAKLREDAAKITKEPDPLLDHYLSQPGPTAAQVKKYIGRWEGELVVSRGQNIPMDIEILIEDGKAKLLSVVPWDKTKREEPLIFYVDKEGTLIFGRRNRGAGLIISTATIDNMGKLTGLEKWIGAVIPDNVPASVQELMKFTISNPNRFSLVRKNK